MEHQTGPEGPDGTEVAAWASVTEAASEPEAESAPETASAPEAVSVPQAVSVPTTGEPRVDAALRLLDRLPGLPVSEHPELFEQVHAQLSDVLGELDSGPAGPAGD
jgi:hypothetical protein